MTLGHQRRQPGRGLGRRVAEIVADQSFPERHGSALADPRVVPFDAVPVAMLVADASAAVLAVNARWVAMSGRSAASSLGPGWLEGFDPLARGRMRAEIRRVAEAGEATIVECRMGAPPSVTTRWLLASYQWAGETLVGIVAESLAAEPIAAEPAGSEAAGDARRGGEKLQRGDEKLRRRLVAELPAVCTQLEELLARIEGEISSP